MAAARLPSTMIARLLPRMQTARATMRLASTSVTQTAKGEVTKKPDDDFLEAIAYEDLPRAQKRYVKLFEKVNEERVKEMFQRNYKNHISFVALICVAVGIYFYTMYAVRQETFLEEIDAEMAAERPATHGHLAPEATAKKGS